MTAEEIQAELEIDREIDPNNLDAACVAQADLFCKWAERLAKAKVDLKRKDYENDVLFSKLEIKCRRDPAYFKLEKITESGIKAAVMASDRYAQEMRKYFDLMEEMELLDAAVKAMDVKKRMLEELGELHGQQYFAGPSVPHNLAETWLAYHKRQTERVNERQLKAARRRRVARED